MKICKLKDCLNFTSLTWTNFVESFSSSKVILFVAFLVAKS